MEIDVIFKGDESFEYLYILDCLLYREGIINCSEYSNYNILVNQVINQIYSSITMVQPNQRITNSYVVKRGTLARSLFFNLLNKLNTDKEIDN